MKVEGSITNMKMQQVSKIDQKEVHIKQGQKKENIEQEREKENIEQEQKNFPGEKQLIKSIEKANKDLRMTNTSLKFSIHEKTKQIMVKVMDDNKHEVIREIPSEKILDMVADMMEMTGIFINKEV